MEKNQNFMLAVVFELEHICAGVAHDSLLTYNKQHEVEPPVQSLQEVVIATVNSNSTNPHYFCTALTFCPIVATSLQACPIIVASCEFHQS